MRVARAEEIAVRLMKGPEENVGVEVRTKYLVEPALGQLVTLSQRR